MSLKSLVRELEKMLLATMTGNNTGRERENNSMTQFLKILPNLVNDENHLLKKLLFLLSLTSSMKDY